MATIKTNKRKGGNAYQIQYTVDGGRRWLSLGSKYRKEDAQEIGRIVDRLVAAYETERPLDRQTAQWLDAASDDLRDRLERAGLISIKRVPTLGEIFRAYRDAEVRLLKPTTQTNKEHSFKRFFEFVDESTKFDEFTKRDAAKFPAFLDATVSEATRAGTIKDVRRAFNWAVAEELIERNPFDGVKRGSFKNKSREYYVTMADYRKMLDACPSRMWRALLALYRVGGLRYEEALRAQWSDVDFARGRLLVHSPKTERYKGRDSRVVPLFPELREELEAWWEETPEGGSPYIVSDGRRSIRASIERIVFYAGLNRWERLIQNFRSSRAIEIAREFGELAESEWIGHSPQTAKDHYLHVLDEDFERASSGRFLPRKKTTAKTTAQEGEFRGLRRTKRDAGATGESSTRS